MPRPGTAGTPEFAEAVRQSISQQLGAALRPHEVYCVTDMPKTRSAKIMRRVIRAAYLGLPPGDVTALENPDAVDSIAAIRQTGSSK